MDEESQVRTGRKMFLFVWIILFALIFSFFYLHDKKQASDFQIENGSLSIKANQQGHYQIKGSINGMPVEFMIDTGASYVAVPKGIADRLQLTGRYPVTLETANGQATGLLTRLETLTFGNFQLKNVKAVILSENEGDDIVLLGMNVLSKFNLSQKEKHLIIQK